MKEKLAKEKATKRDKSVAERANRNAQVKSTMDFLTKILELIFSYKKLCKTKKASHNVVERIRNMCDQHLTEAAAEKGEVKEA